MWVSSRVHPPNEFARPSDVAVGFAGFRVRHRCSYSNFSPVDRPVAGANSQLSPSLRMEVCLRTGTARDVGLLVVLLDGILVPGAGRKALLEG